MSHRAQYPLISAATATPLFPLPPNHTPPANTCAVRASPFAAPRALRLRALAAAARSQLLLFEEKLSRAKANKRALKSFVVGARCRAMYGDDDNEPAW